MSFASEPPRAFTRGRAAERHAAAPHDRRARSRHPKTRQYTPRQVELAAAAVHVGRMAYREAAAVYAIPKSTIGRWASRGAGVGRGAARSPGAQPVITDAEEEFLLDCLLRFSDQYTPMTFHTLVNSSPVCTLVVAQTTGAALLRRRGGYAGFCGATRLGS